MWIFAVNVVNMQRCSQCIFPEIIQSQKCRKSGSSHASHQCTFLCIKTVWPDTFMSHKMKCLIFVCIISFLKNRDVIHTTFMQILIFVYIHRINLNSDIFEIFSCNLYSFTDIFHIRICATLSCQYQDLFHTGLCNDLHLMFNFFKRQLFTPDIIVAIKSTVNAVILAVIRNI